MEKVFLEMIETQKETNRLLQSLVEHVEDARAEAIKRDCSEAMKRQMADMMDMMKSTPLGPILQRFAAGAGNFK